MKKLMTLGAAGVLAIVLASCGGSSNNAGKSSNASISSASTVLVDATGMTLYTPDGESASNVRCTASCSQIWKPLRPGSAKLAGSAVITRPDGTKQVAVAGKPVYTFVQDTPGAVTGDGASDAFGGKKFTWHAVQAGGKTAAAPAKSAPKGGYSNGY